MKHLLLMSSSRQGDMGYLEHAREQCGKGMDAFLEQILKMLKPWPLIRFIPISLG